MCVSGVSGAPWGGVALEVRRTAYLRDVRVWQEGGALHAAGVLVGTAPGQLDLYLVADRRSAAYTSLMPSEYGVGFHLEGACAEVAREVAVELVGGAVAWYRFERLLAQGSGA
jgi:hypothetical protein